MKFLKKGTLFLPTASSKTIPAHCPEANCVSPKKAMMPNFPAAFTLVPTWIFSEVFFGGLNFDGGLSPDILNNQSQFPNSN